MSQLMDEKELYELACSAYLRHTKRLGNDSPDMPCKNTSAVDLAKGTVELRNDRGVLAVYQLTDGQLHRLRVAESP